MGFSSIGSGFLRFGGIETKTDLPKSISSGEDPPPTVRIVGLADFRSVPIKSSGWVRSRMGLDKPRVHYECEKIEYYITRSTQ